MSPKTEEIVDQIKNTMGLTIQLCQDYVDLVGQPPPGAMRTYKNRLLNTRNVMTQLLANLNNEIKH